MAITSPELTRAIPGPHNVTRTMLENGLIVLVYETPHTQSVVMTGSLHAGSIYESPERAGLATITANALTHGTQHRDFDTLHANLEDIGAEFSAYSGVHRIGFNGKGLAEDLPGLVEILADCLRYPTFPQGEIERLIGQHITWLDYHHDDTQWVANRAFHSTLYPANHAYHHGSRGTLETLPTLAVDEIRAFHEQFYGPNRMILSIVGAVDSQEAVETVRHHLEDWHNPNQPEMAQLPKITTPTETMGLAVELAGKTQADIVIGTLGPSRFDDDYQAANIANSILGEFAMMGRIGEIIREREGLAYYAYSRLEGGVGQGAWSINAGVNPANIERTLELCLEELRRFTSEPISEDDLRDNQSYFTGRLPLQLESNDGTAHVLHLLELYDLGLDYLVNYHDHIYGLTADDVSAAAQKYLNPDALVIAVAGPDLGFSME